jgi:hypothetical protein
MTTVEIVSAPWCKRCHALKPEIEKHCTMNAAALTVVDFEEMDETEKATISSLPTIRTRPAGATEWQIYTANTFDDWKRDLVAITIKTATADTDF